MTPIDFLWMFGWFVVGIIVFQVHGIRDYWGQTSEAYSAISLLSLFLGFIYGTLTLQNITMTLIGSIILGILSTLAYLIGANISRAIQFGEMSPKIIVYILVFIFLILTFISII